MVDKLWYDWQRRLPINKNAFGGGSTSVFGLADMFPQFPTGMPPYLNVSAPEYPECSVSNLILRSIIPPSPATGSGRISRFGTSSTPKPARCATFISSLLVLCLCAFVCETRLIIVLFAPTNTFNAI